MSDREENYYPTARGVEYRVTVSYQKDDTHTGYGSTIEDAIWEAVQELDSTHWTLEEVTVTEIVAVLRR